MRRSNKFTGDKVVVDSMGTMLFCGKLRWSAKPKQWEQRLAWTLMAAALHIDYEEWTRRVPAATM